MVIWLVTDCPTLQAKFIGDAEATYQELLEGLESNLQARYRRRCEEAVLEGMTVLPYLPYVIQYVLELFFTIINTQDKSTFVLSGTKLTSCWWTICRHLSKSGANCNRHLLVAKPRTSFCLLSGLIVACFFHTCSKQFLTMRLLLLAIIHAEGGTVTR